MKRVLLLLSLIAATLALAPESARAQASVPRSEVRQVPLVIKCVNETHFDMIFGSDLKTVFETRVPLSRGATQRQFIAIRPDTSIVIYYVLEEAYAPDGKTHCVLDFWQASSGIVEPPAPGDET